MVHRKKKQTKQKYFKRKKIQNFGDILYNIKNNIQLHNYIANRSYLMIKALHTFLTIYLITSLCNVRNRRNNIYSA